MEPAHEKPSSPDSEAPLPKMPAPALQAAGTHSAIKFLADQALIRDHGAHTPICMHSAWPRIAGGLWLSAAAPPALSSQTVCAALFDPQ